MHANSAFTAGRLMLYMFMYSHLNSLLQNVLEDVETLPAHHQVLYSCIFIYTCSHIYKWAQFSSLKWLAHLLMFINMVCTSLARLFYCKSDCKLYQPLRLLRYLTRKLGTILLNYQLWQNYLENVGWKIGYDCIGHDLFDVQ